MRHLIGKACYFGEGEEVERAQRFEKARVSSDTLYWVHSTCSPCTLPVENALVFNLAMSVSRLFVCVLW